MVTRDEILARARGWVAAGVPYSMSRYRDGWRTDCSGMVSMAWRLASNHWTGNLATAGLLISRASLLPGDMLLFHNKHDPHSGSHVVLFERWVGAVGGDFWILEQTPPRARRIRWSATRGRNLSNYLPFRPRNVAASSWSEVLMADLPTLVRGSRGPAVRRLQAIINTRGGVQLEEDGDFGPRTDAAVRAVQGQERIDVDGEVGPNTWRAVLTD